jgi:hypothetical protein
MSGAPVHRLRIVPDGFTMDTHVSQAAARGAPNPGTDWIFLMYLDFEAVPERIDRILAGGGAGFASILRKERWFRRGMPFDCRHSSYGSLGG